MTTEKEVYEKREKKTIQPINTHTLDCCERGLGTRVDRKMKIVEHDAGGR